MGLWMGCNSHSPSSDAGAADGCSCHSRWGSVAVAASPRSFGVAAVLVLANVSDCDPNWFVVYSEFILILFEFWLVCGHGLLSSQWSGSGLGPLGTPAAALVPITTY